MPNSQVAERYEAASEDTRRQIDRLLQQDADDQAWAEQLGPAYRQRDVADLLDKTPQAVSQDRRLLKLTMRSGTPGYPVFQFDGRTILDGISQVIVQLSPAVATPWTIASWLTSPQPTLDDQRPVDLLRDRQIDPVVTAARRFAAALAA